ncbi:FxsA family protein [Devosia sp.]|uniref:FxsA family protein n=1 Tax=Devosia sp. TaxID=1871048 RepID=UPI0032642EB7
MVRFVILGFLLLPIFEIALFIKVGQAIGLFPTLALVILAAVAGAMLLRHQGLAVLNQLRSNVNSGRMPARTVADAMMIGLAALFLVLPGFFSDAVAILLLLPPVRGWIYQGLASRVVVRTTSGGGTMERESPRVTPPGTIDLDKDDYEAR